MELTRYNSLELKDALIRSCDYVESCYELSILLRHFYVSSSKSLQNAMQKDVITAFHQPYFLHSKRCRSAVQCVLNAVENVFPRQKRISIANEFKQSSLKLHRQQKKLIQALSYSGHGLNQSRLGKLPSDVLFNIFKFLDVSSLASALCVCHDWSIIAKNNLFWEKHFRSVFEKDFANSQAEDEKISEIKNFRESFTEKNENLNVAPDFWRHKFYEERSRFPNKMRISNRVFCNTCKKFFWLKFASFEIAIADLDRQNEANCKRGQKHFFSFLRSSDIVQFLSRQIDDDWVFDSEENEGNNDDGYGEYKFWSIPCI